MLQPAWTLLIWQVALLLIGAVSLGFIARLLLNLNTYLKLRNKQLRG